MIWLLYTFSPSTFPSPTRLQSPGLVVPQTCPIYPASGVCLASLSLWCPYFRPWWKALLTSLRSFRTSHFRRPFPEDFQNSYFWTSQALPHLTLFAFIKITLHMYFFAYHSSSPSKCNCESRDSDCTVIIVSMSPRTMLECFLCPAMNSHWMNK